MLNTEITLDNLYFPGHIHISEELRSRHVFKTLSDPNQERNEIYMFNGQIYVRAEEIIRKEASKIYMEKWKMMLADCNEFLRMNDPDNEAIGHVKRLSGRLKNAIDQGVTVNDINEVLADIRRNTYTDKSEMNPESHIPFLNGFLNLKTRKLEEFNPDYFYTWQVNANYIEKHVTLNDTPEFRKYLELVYYTKDIPMILSYLGYALQPTFPRNKVLGIFGKERIGKGTLTRIMKGLIPKGYGSISYEKLLISENRFVFQNIIGKNVLVDMEIKRKFKKGSSPDYANFNKLFGSDVLDVEMKGKTPFDYVNRAKGIFIGNLPIPPLDNSAAISRFLVVKTRDKRDMPEVQEIENIILEKERDLIAKLLIECYFGLQDRNYRFPGEMTNEETADLWDLLSDPIANFIDEMTEVAEGLETEVNYAYQKFTEWCDLKGITPIAKQTFTANFKRTYPKKYAGGRGNRHYVFMNCKIISDMKSENSEKVKHGSNDSESLKYSGSENEMERVQLWSHEITYLNSKEDDIHVYKKIEPKLNTGQNTIKPLEKSDSPDTKKRVQLFLEDIKKEFMEMLASNLNPMRIPIFFDILSEKLKERIPDITDSERREAFKIVQQWHEFDFDYNSQIVTLVDPKNES